MSFGYSIGDLIGGANMTYKLIRILSDTRGACVEYQEAMAELCAMQQAFIQVSQMSSHNASGGAGIMPLATVNSASFIVMSSMDTIAAFLERTKKYQRRLSKEGEAAGGSRGIEGSWCKMGWALFKKEELRELRDSLHARLASINTLLTAAHHIHRLPASVAQFQVAEYPEQDGGDEPSLPAYSQDADEDEHVFLEEDGDFGEGFPRPDELSKAGVNDFKGCVTPAQDDDSNESPCPLPKATPSPLQLDSRSMSSLSTLVQSPTSTTVASPLSSPETPITPLTPDGFAPSPAASLAEAVPKDAKTSTSPPQPQKKMVAVEDLESYVQNLVVSARKDWEREQQQRGGAGRPRASPQPPATTPRRVPPPRQAGGAAAPAQRDADDAEWRRRVEDLARVKAEIEIRNRFEAEKQAAEAAQKEQEARKKAEEELRRKYVEEGMMLAEANRKKEDKAPVKFKDAVGRKFSFPFHQCQTWQGMEELIKQAFLHVEVLGPLVQQGHFDLMGPDGDIVLPAVWDKAVQPDWSVTMHMWPMDRLPNPPPRFGGTRRPRPPPTLGFPATAAPGMLPPPPPPPPTLDSPATAPPGMLPPSPPPPPTLDSPATARPEMLPPPPQNIRPRAPPRAVNAPYSSDDDSMADSDKRKKKGGLSKLFTKGKWWRSKKSRTDNESGSDSTSIVSDC